jgi:DNA-binding GntR family transcriptional regulator
MREIDRESSTPPSRQIADHIRADIAAGKYAPGQRLPSIADIVQEFGVARDTAAKALAILVDAGDAYREHGMGTYAART